MSDEIRAAQRERIAELEAELKQLREDYEAMRLEWSKSVDERDEAIERLRGEALEWRLACDQWRGMTIEQQADYGQLQAEVERVREALEAIGRTTHEADTFDLAASALLRLRGDLHQREEQQ
jgi:methyl-accepting chemotaxis protein